MARPIRPRVLAAGFGAYFVIIAIVSYQYVQGLPTAWYLADITRWIYTTYMLVAAVFLVGAGGLAVSIRSSFSRQIRELDARLGSMVRGAPQDALPPPLPETPNVRDTVDRDIDELLESLSEVEETATREVQVMDLDTNPVIPTHEDDGELATRRERLLDARKFLGRYLIGPAIVAALILGFSGMMLPGADGFAQTYYKLNTALILGIGYSWVGVGWYVAVTVWALVGGRDEGRGK